MNAFNNIRAVRWPVVSLAMGAQFMLLLLVNRPSMREHFPLLTSTAGASWMGLLIVVGGVMMLWGGLRRRDLGLDHPTTQIVQALAVSVGFWSALQLAISAVVLVREGVVTANPAFTNGSGLGLLGGLVVEQWLGNALHEEVIFRGFLLVQMTLYLMRSKSLSTQRSVLTAVVASQVVFALMHLPHRVLAGVSGTSLIVYLALVFACGLLYAVLYLRSKNLFLVVGLHGLFNDPVALVHCDIDTIQLVWGILAILLLLMWSRVGFAYTHRPNNPAAAGSVWEI